VREMPLLDVKALTVQFGGVRALDRVDLAVESGMIYGLIGPNGAGKSTLFNCLSRIYTPDQGGIHFDGSDLLKLAPHELARIGLARTFQNTELFRSMTVLEHLTVGQHLAGRTGLLASALGLGRREAERHRQRAEEILQFLGLEAIRDWGVAALPLGQQKLVELGRALVGKPKLLLLDEPAAGMNSAETDRLGALIQHIRTELGVTVLLVEHDMPLVMGVCDRILVVEFGRRIAEGTPAEIQNDTRVIQAYLGEESSLAETEPALG
jgi:branched-chain amino acid transport system ATP-binding protein